MKLVQVFKNSARTAQKTHRASITEINSLTLFKETVSAYSENRTKVIDTRCEQNAGIFDFITGDTCVLSLCHRVCRIYFELRVVEAWNEGVGFKVEKRKMGDEELVNRDVWKMEVLGL
jgi:hypothetical protein